MENKRGFERLLGLWGSSEQGIAAMLGGGVLVLTGFAAGLTGPSLPLGVFLVAMLSAFPTLLVYAELGTARPEAGGGLLWIREGLGPLFGHFAGWFSWFAHVIACVVYALSFGFSLSYFLDQIVFPILGITLPVSPGLVKTILAAGAILVFSWVNYRGVKSTEVIGRIVVLSSLGAIFLFVVFGFVSMFTMPEQKYATEGFLLHGIGGLLQSMGLMVIAFQGFEVVAQGAEEMKNPKRDLPRALFISFGVVLLVSVLIVVVALFGVSGSEPSWKVLSDSGEGALAKTAQYFPLPTILVPVIILGGAIVGIAALNATIFSASHVFYAMAHRGRSLPVELDVLHPKYRTPIAGIIISAAVMLAMIKIPVKDVAALADLVFIVIFALVHIAFLQFRKKYPDLARPFRVPFHPLPSFVALLMYGILVIQIIHLNPWSLTIFFMWLIAGIIIQRTYVESHERGVLNRGKIREDSRAVNQESKYFIFFPVLCDTSWWREALPYVVALARQKNGTIFLWSLIERPTTGEKDWLSKEEDEAADRFFKGVQEELWKSGVSRSLRSQLVADISSERVLDMTDTVLRAVGELDIDLLVIPHEHTTWHQRFMARARKRISGEAFQKILREARCDLLMFKTTSCSLPKSQLICFTRGNHEQLLQDVASAFTQEFGLEVFESSGDNAESLLETCKSHDLLLMGAAKSLAFGSTAAIGETAQYVIEHSQKTVFICYHHGAFPLFAPLQKLLNGITSKLRTLKVEK